MGRSRGFTQQVRDALGRLNDPASLAIHPLAQEAARRAHPGQSAGEMLQAQLLAAIEQLRPVSADAARALAVSRRYQLVRLRYVEEHTVAQVCRALAVSETEYYRTHTQALDQIAMLVASSMGHSQTLTTADPNRPPRVAATDRPFGREPFRTPLVGRRAELAFLMEQFGAAASGDGGRMVAIGGDAGVGKTRLVEELGLWVQAQEGQLLVGRYLREGRAAYAPWVEALRPALQALRPQVLARMVHPYLRDLMQIFPELIRLPITEAPDTSPDVLTPADRRQRLHDGLASLLGVLADDRPAVLLLDDCHWAPSLAVLAHIARRLAGANVLLVATYRESELAAQPELAQSLNDLQRADLLTAITLRPLDEAETTTIIAHHFGTAAARLLAPHVFRATRGNPFFIEETLESLLERGVVQPKASGWAVTDGASIGLPESVQHLVRERVALLGRDGATTLAQASILGLEFPHRDLLGLASVDEEALASILARAITMRLLVDRSQGGVERYGFVDDQVKDALYQAIPLPQRRQWHRTAGQLLAERVGENDDQYLEELARHFVEGNDPERGAAYSFRAGRKAAAVYAWPQAVSYYRQALVLWDQMGGHAEQRAEVCLQLGDTTYRSTLDVSQGIRYLERALSFCQELRDQFRQGMVHLAIGREYANSANVLLRDQEQALGHFHLARAVFEALPESPQLCDVYGALADAHAFRFDGVELVSWAKRAVEIAERVDDLPRTVQTRSTLGAALAATGRVRAGLTRITRAYRLAMRHRLGIPADLALSHLCWINKTIDPRAVLVAVRRSTTHQTIPTLFWLPGSVLVACARTGDLAQGRRVLAALRKRVEASGQPQHGVVPAEVGFFLARCGEWEEAERLLLDAFQWAVASHDRSWEALVGGALAELYFLQRDYQRAEAYLVEAVGLRRRGGYVLGLVELLALLAELRVATGQLDAASQAVAEAKTILLRRDRWGRLAAAVDLAESVVDAARGRWTEAKVAAARALEHYRTHGLRWEEARAHESWGRAVAAAPSGYLEARGHLEQAAHLWDSMGAPAFADRCRTRLN